MNSSLPKLAADVEARRQEALTHVEQADKALAEPFKHADALKAAQADSVRINQLMADTSEPEEPAQPEQPEPLADIDSRREMMQRLMNASFPPQPGTAAVIATTAQPRTPDQRRQQQTEYGR